MVVGIKVYSLLQSSSLLSLKVRFMGMNDQTYYLKVMWPVMVKPIPGSLNYPEEEPKHTENSLFMKFKSFIVVFSPFFVDFLIDLLALS
jgi:hypothetical protein